MIDQVKWRKNLAWAPQPGRFPFPSAFFGGSARTQLEVNPDSLADERMPLPGYLVWGTLLATLGIERLSTEANQA